MIFFRYFVADVRASVVQSGLVRDTGSRPLACGVLSMCVHISVSSHRCRCFARFLDYMYSWEADFEGFLCLPEDYLFAFQFLRTGLWHVALMSRLCVALWRVRVCT